MQDCALAAVTPPRARTGVPPATRQASASRSRPIPAIRSPHLPDRQLLRARGEVDAISTGGQGYIRPAIDEYTQMWARVLGLPPGHRSDGIDDPPGDANEFTSFEVFLPHLQKVDPIGGEASRLLDQASEAAGTGRRCMLRA